MIFDNLLGINDKIFEDKAIIYRHRVYSSREIREKVGALTQRLETIGITPRHRIGIMTGNTPLFICALLAVVKLRASTVLFSTYFKRYELQDYIKDTGIRHIIADEQSSPIIQGLSYKKKQLCSDTDELLGHLDIWSITQPRRGKNPYPKVPAPTPEGNEFILQFTSGTGGKSKIVPRSYRNVADEILNVSKTISMTSEDIVVCPVPLFHSYGLIPGLLCSLYTCATFILMERFIPNDFVKIVDRYKPSVFTGIPFMYNLLGKTFLSQPVDFSSLRLCLSAGAKLSVEVADKFTQRYGIRISQLYGSTEAGVMAVNVFPDGFDDINSVGTPATGRFIKIVDGNDHELPAGKEGEIKIYSPGTTSGYLNRQELNREVFKEGWFLTGDIGKIDPDDHLYITGRKSTFINVAGLKVDPFEIERVLLSRSDIKECAVVGVMDQKSLEEKIKVYIVPEKKLSAIDIRQFSRERLAEYKVPREIEFVDELPKSPTGKVLLKYLIK
jgi:long-chain acyl-CoA synthetase